MSEIQATLGTDALWALDRCDMVTTLVEEAKNGSKPSFEELFRIYRKQIYHVTYSITRRHEDAEDALQDAFLRAYANLDTFRQESQFHSWLVRIAMNCSLMLLRKRRRRGERMSGSPNNSDEQAFLVELEDKLPNPEQSFLYEQCYLETLSAIRKLPPPLRVVAELRVLCDQSPGEIHENLGITNAAVKSRLFRVRQRLARNEQFKRQKTSRSKRAMNCGVIDGDHRCTV